MLKVTKGLNSYDCLRKDDLFFPSLIHMRLPTGQKKQRRLLSVYNCPALHYTVRHSEVPHRQGPLIFSGSIGLLMRRSLCGQLLPI